jgi:osmoprotectant transport system substrate-binding protein
LRTYGRIMLLMLLVGMGFFVLGACAADDVGTGDDAAVEEAVDAGDQVSDAADDSQGDDADSEGADAVDDDAAAGEEPVKLVVGSKDFTEEFIVAERAMSLGGTPVAHQAILDGDIDLYPEYSSTGLLTVLQLEPLEDAAAIVEAVRQGYQEQFGLTWLDPAPFNNSQALATTQEVAAEYGLATYSDLAEAAPELRLGGPAEFTEREDGIPGLQAAYGGFEFADFVQLGSGPLRYDALAGGEIDVVVAFGTDGRIAGDNLVLLEDDKHLYPIYQIAPVVRMDTLQDNPTIADALNPLAPLLDDETMSRLNSQVDVEGLEYPDVARDFLVANGLIAD